MSDQGAADRSGTEADEDDETRWVVQWSEPVGENQAKRVVDTEAEAEAVVEAMQERYEPVEGEPGLYRVELGAEVYFTTVEVPYGPLPDDW
jgi:predicted component of type VI protein secretion system